MQAHEVVGRIQFLGGIRERPQFLVPSVGSPNVQLALSESSSIPGAGAQPQAPFQLLQLPTYFTRAKGICVSL